MIDGRMRILVLLLFVFVGLVCSPTAGFAAAPPSSRLEATAPAVSRWQELLEEIREIFAEWTGASPSLGGAPATGSRITNPTAGHWGDDGCHIDPLGCPN
jgi:hypothetical protein